MRALSRELLNHTTLNQVFPDAHKNLAAALMGQGRRGEVAACWLQALEVAPGNGSGRHPAGGFFKSLH